MPIDLRDLPSNTNIKNYSPKYFCDKLTGNSKGTRGLLTSMHDPAMINEKIMPSIPSAEYIACRRQKGVRNNNTETTSVPFNPLSSSVWDSMRQYTLPSLSKLCKFGTDKKHDMTGYLQLCVHSLILEETTKPATAKTQSSISRKLVVCYQLFFFFKKGNSADRHDIVTHISSVNPSGYNRNIYGYRFAELFHRLQSVRQHYRPRPRMERRYAYHSWRILLECQKVSAGTNQQHRHETDAPTGNLQYSA